MIELLTVRDLAVVEKADIAFGAGLNTITGETGAGKSVLLGAIALLTGARGEKGQVRTGASKACVSARIVLPPKLLAQIAPILEEAGIDPCEEGALLLSRSLSSSGTNRCSINNCPASVQLLKRIGVPLVDFHGPHDNQSLLSPEFQMEALDSFGGTSEALAHYQEKWRALCDLQKRLQVLAGDDGAIERELDLLRYQVNELAEAHLSPEEDGVALQEAYTAASNSARIIELGSLSVAALSDGEGNVVDAAATAIRALEELAGLFPAAKEWARDLSGYSSAISDMARDIQSQISDLDASPERLAELESRISLVETLRHKYGRTIEDVIAFHNKAAARLAELESRGDIIADLERQIQSAKKALQREGATLTKARVSAAIELGKAVTRELSDLGLTRAAFEVRVSPATVPHESGLDAVEYGFAPNPGEVMRPLRQIASSGEISRVMLALKTVLAAHDMVPVLIFDEIDANVGGEIALVVGRKLAGLGASHQVLCITHLPQVAACGKSHFAVRKQVLNDRTFTSINLLSRPERVDELSRMLGGSAITSVVRKHAEELLGPA